MNNEQAAADDLTPSTWPTSCSLVTQGRTTRDGGEPAEGSVRRPRDPAKPGQLRRERLDRGRPECPTGKADPGEEGALMSRSDQRCNSAKKEEKVAEFDPRAWSLTRPQKVGEERRGRERDRLVDVAVTHNDTGWPDMNEP